MEPGADHVVVWEVAGRDDYGPEAVRRRDRLADAARAGRWEHVLAALEQHDEWADAPRLGSRSGYRPLHQAAWHGADPAVVRRILELGGLRTTRTTDGDRPVDIAAARGHRPLVELLDVDPAAFPPAATTAALQTHLHALMTGRAAEFGVDRPLRLPPVEAVVELGGRGLSCPIPGMYGGFALAWRDGAIVADSWCRVSGGSGQRHRVGVDGVELIADRTDV
jgi:hypothetical protein